MFVSVAVLKGSFSFGDAANASRMRLVTSWLHHPLERGALHSLEKAYDLYGFLMDFS